MPPSESRPAIYTVTDMVSMLKANSAENTLPRNRSSVCSGSSVVENTHVVDPPACVVTAPAAADERSHQSTDAAAAHQQTHAEHACGLGIEAADLHWINALAEDRQQHPVGRHEAEPALDEQRRHEPAVAAYVAD